MAKTKTSFSKDNPPPKDRPPRGKARRTKLLDALKKQGKTEAQFYEFCVQVAMGTLKVDEDGKQVQMRPDIMMLKDVLRRVFPENKPTFPEFEVPEFKEDDTLLEKATCILDSIALGEIPVDAGKLMIDIMNTLGTIEERDELKARIEALEEKLERSTEN